MNKNIKLKIILVFLSFISGVVCFGGDTDTVIINQSGKELNFKISVVPLLVREELRIMVEKFLGENNSIVVSGAYGFNDFVQRNYNRNNNFRVMAIGGGISPRFYSSETKSLYMALSMSLMYYEGYNAEPQIFSIHMYPLLLAWMGSRVVYVSDEDVRIYDYAGLNTQIRFELGIRITHKFFGCIMPEFSIMPGIFFSSTVLKMKNYKGIVWGQKREIWIFPSIDIGFNLLFIVKR